MTITFQKKQTNIGAAHMLGQQTNMKKHKLRNQTGMLI